MLDAKVCGPVPATLVCRQCEWGRGSEEGTRNSAPPPFPPSLLSLSQPQPGVASRADPAARFLFGDMLHLLRYQCNEAAYAAGQDLSPEDQFLVLRWLTTHTDDRRIGEIMRWEDKTKVLLC